MKKTERKIESSRGRDGSIKIESTTLYKSDKVLRQLDAAVGFAESVGLIRKPAKKTAA